MNSQVPISVCGLLCLTAALWPTTGYTATDAEVLALIDSLRPTAETIVVDGDLSDWGAIPFFDDPTGDGRWFVGQGANGSFTHLGSWSYDLTILNDDLKPSIPDMSLDNDDYFAFGAPFFAPASGTVTFATGSNPDNVPFTPALVNNEVQIDIGGGFSVRLLHAKQNTTLVSVDEAVDSSTQIAEVGNSGFSFQTHLHMDVFEAGLTYPLAFRFVDVALNPVDDPWERQISNWEPRDGFFVTVPEPSSALLSITGIVTVLVLAGAKSARD